LGIIPRPVTVEGLSVPVMDAASRPVTPVNMAMSGNAAPPANPVPMSPASSWLLEHPREFEPQEITLDEIEIELLQDVFAEGKIELRIEGGEYAPFPRLIENISGYDAEVIVGRLKGIMKKLKLKKIKDIRKSWQAYQSTGRFYKIPKKPLMYYILDILEKFGTDRFKGMQVTDISRIITGDLNNGYNIKTSVGTLKNNFLDLFKIFRTNDLFDIVKDWKMFKEKGRLPARYLKKQLPLTSVQVEMLEKLSEKPEEYRYLFEANMTTLARKLLQEKMITSGSEESLRNELLSLKNRFNTENLVELIGRYEELVHKDQVNLGVMRMRMPFSSAQVEILDKLAKNAEKYREIFDDEGYKVVAGKLAEEDMKTINSKWSIRSELVDLKNKLNVNSLDDLLDKYRDFVNKGEVNLGVIKTRIPLGSVEIEMLEKLAENTEAYRSLFDNLNYTVMAQKLLREKMKTTDSEGTIRNELAILKSRFNADSLDDLLGKHKELVDRGEVDLGKMKRQVCLNSVQVEILEKLSGNPKKYRALFSHAKYTALVEKLITDGMRTTNSKNTVRNELVSLKDIFNSSNLDDLLGKYKGLVNGDELNLGMLRRSLPLGPLQTEILEELVKNTGEYRELFDNVNYKDLAKKMFEGKIKTTKSKENIQIKLCIIKSRFNADSLDDLLGKYKELVDKNEVNLGVIRTQIPLTPMQVEILEKLSENFEEYKKLIDNDYVAIVAKLLGEDKKGMRTSGSETTVRHELTVLEERFNADGLKDLLDKYKELLDKGKVRLGIMRKRFPLSPMRVELLDKLSKNPDGYVELFETNIKALAEKIFMEKMKTSNSVKSIRRELTELPKIFRLKNKKDLMELLKKWEELKREGKILGFNFFKNNYIT
ncbi:MAG: hypothetical protein ABIH00_01860, partial [Armatimonadota bacterium]